MKTWVIKGKDPYTEVADIIEDWARKNFYDTFLVTLCIDGEITTELLQHDAMGCFEWDNDWWEGQKRISLVGFTPISQAFYIGEPVQGRRCFYVSSGDEYEVFDAKFSKEWYAEIYDTLSEKMRSRGQKTVL